MYFAIFYFFVLLLHVRADLALLSAVSNSTDDRVYCVAYSEEWNLQLPSSPSHYVKLVIPEDSNQDGCHKFSTNYNHSVAVLINNANCSVDDKLSTAHFADVQLLLISGSLDTKGLTNPPVTMVIISEGNADSLDDNTMVTAYLPMNTYPFGGIILLFTITMVTLITASALANEPYKFLRNGLLYRNNENSRIINNVQLSVWQTALTILIFVGLAVSFLILLYFFYSVVVYVAIGIYCLLCVRSVFSFFSPLVALISFTSQWRLPSNNWPLFKHRPDPRFFLTVLFSVAIVMMWFVLRHANYSWILHDLLGFLFICFAVKQFKGFLTRLWPLAVLMIILFVYDIFFVFITPLFTEDSVSVMETVATGEGTGSNEKIPFLFEVPRLTHHTTLELTCDLVTPLLLGYGDVGLPAVLISFALQMDKTLHPTTTLRVYYIITVTGYAIGFLLCIIALTLMKTGQPALLYLVPCTLGLFLMTALIRGDLLIIWRGKKDTMSDSVPPEESNCEEQLKKEKFNECDEDVEQSPLLLAENIAT